MEDIYFKNKADRILSALCMRQNVPDMLDEEYEAAVLLLAFNLKEVAQAQRVACANAMITHCNEYGKSDIIDELTAPIQNAQIKEK